MGGGRPYFRDGRDCGSPPVPVLNVMCGFDISALDGFAC